MKKLLALTTAVGLGAASLQTATAGDREWATAGKVLTGVFAASVISRAIEPPPVVYAAPPVYVQAAPVVQTVQVVQTAPMVQAAPTVVYQQPVYYAPPPVVYVQPAPIYVAPRPVYFAPPPVCVAPAPVVSFHFGFGVGHPYHHRYHRW